MPQKQEQMFWKICVSLYFTKAQKSDRRTYEFLKLLRDVIKTLMYTVDWLIDPFTLPLRFYRSSICPVVQ